MATKLTSVGTVSLTNVGSVPLNDGLEVSVDFSVKKTKNNITYLLTATEQTFRNRKNTIGPYVQISKPASAGFCVLESLLGYDMNKQALRGALTASRKASGKEVELKAAWTELSGQWNLDALVKPHKAHKLAATVNPHTNVSAVAYAFDWRSFSFQPKLNITKRAPTLALSKKLGQGRGTVQGSYSLVDGVSSLTWSRQPAKVSLRTKVRNGKMAPPTISFTLDRSYTSMAAAKSKAKENNEVKAPTTAAAPASSSNDLAEKLRRLDAAYEAEFARLETRRNNGIESVTYKR